MNAQPRKASLGLLVAVPMVMLSAVHATPVFGRPPVPGNSPAAAVAVKANPAAWAAIKAAYHALNGLAGYRTKTIQTSGHDQTVAAPGVTATVTVPKTTETMDVVPPDRIRHTINMGQQYHESITVGAIKATQSTVSGDAHGWKCYPARPGAALRLGPDPTFANGATIIRRPDIAIDGIAVHDYRATVPVSPTWVMSTDFYVDAKTGLLVRVVSMSSKRGSTTSSGAQTTSYYDYGAKINIALPAACASGSTKTRAQ